jgi:hypothetical protein
MPITRERFFPSESKRACNDQQDKKWFPKDEKSMKIRDSEDEDISISVELSSISSKSVEFKDRNT